MDDDRTGPGPGDVYGDKNRAFLVIEHEEAGCNFVRAICIIPTPEYSYCYLLPHRDDEVGEFFFNSGLYKLGSVEPGITALMERKWGPPKIAKPKRARKRAKS